MRRFNLTKITDYLLRLCSEILPISRLEVSLSQEVVQKDGGKDEIAIIINIENAGESTTVVKTVGLSLRRNFKVTFPSNLPNLTLPQRLKPQKKLQFWKSPNELLDLLRWEGFEGETEISAFVEDSKGGLHYSPWMVLNLDER